MKLNEYIKINYPSIVDEYCRYLCRDALPHVGETVVTLHRGFGGNAGIILTVKEIDELGITLTDGENEYFSMKDVWYKEIMQVGKSDNLIKGEQ